MVWSIHGEREATCAMNNMRWKIRLSVGPRKTGGACTVAGALSLSKTDRVDVGAVAAAADQRSRPAALTFRFDEEKARLDATLTTVVPGWGADDGAEVAPSEEATLRAMAGTLLNLRTFFSDPLKQASDRDAEVEQPPKLPAIATTARHASTDRAVMRSSTDPHSSRAM